MDEERSCECHHHETHHECGHKSAHSARRIGPNLESTGSIPFVEGERNDEKARHDEKEVERKHSTGNERRSEVIKHWAKDDEESSHAVKSRHVVQLLDRVDGCTVDRAIVNDRCSDSRCNGIGAGVVRLVSLFAGRHCHRLRFPLLRILLEPRAILTQERDCSLSHMRSTEVYRVGTPKRDRAVLGRESRSQRAATTDPSMEKCTPSGRQATPSRFSVNPLSQVID